MKISVNNRLESSNGNGIPTYIHNLRMSLDALDSYNNYIYLHKGSVYSPNFFNIFKDVFFDQFFSYLLARYNNSELFFSPANILPFFKSPKIKYVVTIHDLAFITNPDNQSVLFNIYYKHAVRHSAKIADLIITVSLNTKKDLIKFFNINEEKIVVIYPGVKKITSKESLEELPSDKYFLSVTTHPKRKNILSVLKAIARSDILIRYKYIIVGKISEEALMEIKKLAQILNIEENIIFTGYVKDSYLNKLYSNALFLIYPSFYEGFGFPVIEAMMNNCFVLASNNSSLIELTPDKRWLVDPNVIEDIKMKMEEVINLKKEERIKIIYNNHIFSQSFNWLRTSNEVINVFNKAFKM